MADRSKAKSKAKARLDKSNMTPNKPVRTPGHPKKSHAVLAKEGGKEKLIRFGEQGASTAGKPKAGESDKMKKKRASFKARHGKNISKGKMSAAYWADKVKWWFIMANKKAQDFLAKKKEEAKGKLKEKEEGKKGRDTSKMPEGLRKHFEKKGK